MEINSFLPQTRIAALQRGALHQSNDLAGPTGTSLSRRDVELIRKATGVFFSWPPRKEEGFPDAAMEVALTRMRTEAAGQPWNGVTADVLRDLRQRGLITAEGLKQGLDSLAKPTGTDSNGALPTVHEAALAASHQATSVTGAIEMYL